MKPQLVRRESNQESRQPHGGSSLQSPSLRWSDSRHGCPPHARHGQSFRDVVAVFCRVFQALRLTSRSGRPSACLAGFATLASRFRGHIDVVAGVRRGTLPANVPRQKAPFFRGFRWFGGTWGTWGTLYGVYRLTFFQTFSDRTRPKIARMLDSDSAGQAEITSAKLGSTASSRAPTASDSASPLSENAVFPEENGGCSSPVPSARKN